MKRDLIIASAIVIGTFFALICVFTAGFFMGRSTTLRAAGYSSRPGFFFGAAPRGYGRFVAPLPRRILGPGRFYFRNAQTAAGSVQKVEGQALTIQTRNGITRTVLVDNQTRLIRGRRPRYGSRGLRPATLSDLKAGDRVTAIGQRNAQGQITARFLTIMDPSERSRVSRRSFPFRRFR